MTLKILTSLQSLWLCEENSTDMQKGILLSILLILGNVLMAQTTLVDVTNAFTETDANVILTDGQGIDISDCTSWQFTGSWDTDGNDWAGAGNLNSADECGTCAGDPTDPTGGDCNDCWDMLFIDAMTDVGGTVGASTTELVGLDGSSGTSGTWDTGIICNDDMSTTLDLNISLQNWEATSTWNVTINVLCWQIVPTPIISAQCDMGELTLEETSGLGTIDWFIPGNAPPSASDGTGTPFTIDPADSGTHDGDWTVMVTDADGCTGTAIINVALNPVPTVMAIQNGPLCPGEDLILDETGGDGVSWTWDGPNGNIETDDPSSDATVMDITAADAGVYFVTVTDANGCTNTDEVTFDLVVPTVANDDCVDAEMINGVACTISSVAGTTVGACPEVMDVNCTQSVDPTVWYTFTTPAGTTGLDFSNVSGASLQVMSDCPGTTAVGPCISGDTNVPITDGTYWISATTPGGEDNFSFDINFLVPPANDLCADAIVGSGGGTTCCATSDGYGCSNENTVWHVYTILDPSATISIDVANVSITGTMGVDIYIGDCATQTEVIASCLAGSNTFDVSCPGPGDIYVQISNLDNSGCGEYTVTFSETPPPCSLGATCGSDYQLAPITNGAADCQTACNIGICDAAPCSGVGMVWFEVMTDALTSGLIIDINNPEFAPAITVLELDCAGTELVSCSAGASEVVSVVPNFTYYIGISSSDGATGDFELCVSSIQDFSDCGTSDITIIRSEYPDLDSEGPYCVGEKVTICCDVSFVVDQSGTGNNCQWLQGLVPSLGGGWDLDACPLPAAIDQGGVWFGDGEVEYQASASIYGLSSNCNGDPILEVGGGVGPGTPLPGGWYWTSNGNGGGCSNDGNPNTMWGLNGGCGTNQSVSFCFDLQTKTPADAADCLDPCFNELDVSFYTFSDGQTGCWAQNSCAADAPSEFLDGLIDCSALVEVLGPIMAEVCSGEMLDLDYTASDGLSDILVEFTDNPNVSGENGPITWPAGTGEINDVLINDGTTSEVVEYTLTAVNPNPNSGCVGPPLIVEVTVHPDLLIEFDEPYDICWDEQITITPTVSGGQGPPYTYEWDNGDTGASTMAPQVLGTPPGTYTYVVTVTDDSGCTGSEMVEFTIHPEEMITHLQTIFEACQDGINDMADICLTLTPNQNGPFTFDWMFGGGLSATQSGNCLVIDDENSTPGVYDISVLVIDAYGCEYEHMGMMFTINPAPEIELISVTCGANGTYLIDVCDMTGGIPEWNLFDAAYATQLDGTYTGTCATFTINPGDLGITLPATFGAVATYPLTGCLDMLEIMVEPPGIIEFDEPYDVCFDEQITITPTIVGGPGGPYTYNWDNGDTGASTMAPLVIGDPPGTYTYVLTVTDGLGCTATESVDYTIRPEEVITHEQTIFYACKDGIDELADICLTITPGDNGPFTFAWTFAGGLNANPSGDCLVIDDENSTAGVYDISVIVTDVYGCEYEHMGMSFEVFDVPNISLTSIMCSGDLEYSFEVCDLNGGTPEWELFDASYATLLEGPLSGNCVTFIVNPFTLGDLLPVTYGVVATDPITGCFNTFDVEIDPPVVPDFIHPLEACEGEIVTILLNNWDQFQSVTWCDGNTTDQYVTTLGPDDLICTVELTDDYGCTYLEDVEILVNAAVEAEISGSLTFCANGQTVLSTPEDSSYDYAWSNGETSNEITVTVEGTYTVTVSSDNCSATDEVDVVIDFTLEPIMNAEDLCEGESTTISTGENFTDYLWLDPSGLTVTPIPGLPWVIDADQPGEYSVEVSDGTCFGTGTITIDEIPAPFADVDPLDDNPCNDVSGGATLVNLTELVSNATGPVNYIDENGVQINNPTAVNFNGYTAGTYTLMVIIEADDPCPDFEAPIVITVDDCACPGVLFNNIGDFCNNADITRDLSSFLLATTEPGGTFSVLDEMGNLAPNQPAGTLLTINNSWTEGTYTLVYTLANVPNTCPDFHSETFTIYGSPDATLTQTGETVCNTTASGGTTMVDLDFYVNYTGTGVWQDASGIDVPDPNNLNFANQPIGTTATYFYVTTDATEPPCSNLSLPFIISVVDCDCPIIGLNPIIDDLCNTDAEIDLNLFLTAGTETGFWATESPGWSLAGNGIFDPAGLAAGTYVFSYNLNVPTANCDSTVVDSILVFEMPILPAFQDTSLCGSGLNLVFPTNIDLTGIPPLGVTGTWTAPANYNNGMIPDASDVQFVDTLAGNFVFTFTTNTAMGSCVDASMDLTINVQNCDCPIIQIEPFIELCAFDANPTVDLIELEFPLNPGGSWSYGSGPVTNVPITNDVFNATGQPAGTYIFIYTLDNPVTGCTEIDSSIVEVYEPNLLPTDFPSDLEACDVVSNQGTTVYDLEALVGNVPGAWAIPNNFPNTITDFSMVDFENLPTGSTYEFTYTTDDSGTCLGVSETVTITVVDCNCPDVFIDPAPDLCTDGDTFTMDDVLTTATVNGTLGLFDQNGNEINLTNGLIEADQLTEGSYMIIFTATEAIPAECPQGDTTLINIVDPPNAGTGADFLFCDGENDFVDFGTVINETGASTGGTWMETSTTPSIGGFEPITQTFQIENEAPGIYTFEYFFDTSNTPCDPVSAIVTVEIEELPVADAGAGGTLDCDTNFIVVGGSGSSTGNDFEYLWINPAGDTLYQGSNLEFDANLEGEWTLTVQNIVSGCSASATTLIDVDGVLPSFEFTANDAPCNEANGVSTGSIMIVTSTGTPPYLFSINGGEFEAVEEWNNLDPDTYTVSMLDGDGCQSPPSSIIIAQPGPITYDIGNDDLTIQVGETVILESNGLDSLDIATLTWTQNGEVICTGPADGECAQFEVEPPVVPTTYCLEIVTEEGCTAVSCRTLQAQAVRDVYLPNIISNWNGETDANTKFYVHADDYVESVPLLAIYDRWGEMVFSFENGEPNNPDHGWDGTFNGLDVEQGVYVYYIDLMFVGGDKKVFTGSITVTR